MTGRCKRLTDYTLIAVGGDDARSFLQGQFTNDVDRADDGRVVFGAFCNPKGRVLALATIARRSDGFWLIANAGVAAELVTNLKRYVLRAKVTFASLDHHGVVLLDADDADSLAAWTARSDAAGITWSLPGAALQMSAGEQDWLPDECDAGSLDDALIGAGLPEILAATRERFTPQMLNLDVIDGISFDKGCYTGQEIVARTQHLGKIKRRMMLFASSSTDIAAAGDDVVDADGKRIGTVVSAAGSGAGQRMLVVARLDAVATAVYLAGDRVLSSLPTPWLNTGKDQGRSSA